MPRANINGNADSIEFAMNVAASNSFSVDVPPTLGLHMLSIDGFTIGGGSPTLKVKAYTNEAQTATQVLSLAALTTATQTTVITPATGVPTLLCFGPKVSFLMQAGPQCAFPFGLKVVYVAGTGSTGTANGRIYQARA